MSDSKYKFLKKLFTAEAIAGYITVIVFISVFKFIISFDDGAGQELNASTDNSVKVELTKEEKIQRQFSAWDGKHIKLAQTIRQNMNDPDSFEHVETTFAVVEDVLQVKTRYRGNNVYGGKVLGSVTALVDIETGEVLEILESR